MNNSKPGEATMIYLTDRSGSFRCDCGANVFIRLLDTTPGEDRYRCNGCGAVWVGAQ